LVEFRFNLGWLDDVLLFWVGIFLYTNLLVTYTRNRDTDLKLAGNLTEILTLRIAHDDPLVEESMVRLLIQVTEIELIVTDKRIFKEALVHQFDLNFRGFEHISFQVLGFEKDMFVPVCDTRVVDVVLG
jgi:hypothetical protein